MQASAVEIRGQPQTLRSLSRAQDVDLSILGQGDLPGRQARARLRCINFLEAYDSGEIRIDGDLIGYDAPAARCRASACARCARHRHGVPAVQPVVRI